MTTATLPEQRVILHNVSWETYERLMAENQSPGTRFAFDDGTLEIMVVYVGHENPNRTLASIVDVVGEETGSDWHPCGHTTLKREDLAKGVEPDSWFYFGEHAAAIARPGRS